MRARSLVVTMTLAIAAGGCSGDDEESEPEMITAVVEISDRVPLDLYFNLDDEKCYAEAVGTGKEGMALPNVTIENADGRILVTQDGPRIGGRLDGDRCVVPVVLDVEPASACKVIVTGPDGFSVEKAVNGGDIKFVEFSVD